MVHMAVAKSRAYSHTRSVEVTSFCRLDLFQELPTACLKALSRDSQVANFPPGHVFFRPGERGKVLFLLEKGAVQTFRAFGEKKLIIAELKPPAVFGEIGCVGECVYFCSAQALELSWVRTVSKTHFDKLLRRYPLMAKRMLELVSRRFADVLLDLEAMSFRHLIPRLAGLLLAREEKGRIQGLTHGEIAERLCVYRESITAALGELRKAGIISINRKQIRIVNRNRLERVARE